MSTVPFDTLTWLFAGAITLHNIEEALWLPAWSKRCGKLHRPVDPFEFRFAVLILTLLAYGLAAGCRVNTTAPFCQYAITGYALAMLLNVVFPHLAATVFMRQYTPGLATALLLNLPVTILLLNQAFDQGIIKTSVFIYAGPATVLAVLASIPILFFLGRAARPIWK